MMPAAEPFQPKPFSNMLDSTATAQQKPGATPDWKREDGSQKGMGFLGPLKFHDGKTSTELSVGVNIGGKETEIPALVPTLTPPEIQHLLSGGEPTKEIMDKAVAHAMERIQAGKSPFAGPEDYPAQQAPQ